MCQFDDGVLFQYADQQANLGLHQTDPIQPITESTACQYWQQNHYYATTPNRQGH